jgi:uncharacterized YccA/Bax inhibitor family protein
MALIERSSNPMFSEKIFANQQAFTDSQLMTVQGTVNKTFILFALLMFPALYVWNIAFSGGSVLPFVIGGAVVGLISALVAIFKPATSPYTAPIYAVGEGLLLGGISAMFESLYNGIVFQAVSLTFGTLFIMLFAYKAGYIKVTEKFRAGVIAATGGIAFVYFISWIMGMFGVHLPMIHEGGMIGIGFSLLVIVVASLNLVLDFDFIETSARQGAPKFMEWFAGMGLLMTLIWLYLEFLRLLSKLNRQ